MAIGNYSTSCIEFLKSLYQDHSRFYNPYYDNSGKYGSHFTWGVNSLWLGDVVGCKRINASRYCVLDLVVSHDQGKEEESQHNLKWGLCVPNNCGIEDIRNNSEMIFKEFFKEQEWMHMVGSNLVGHSCMENMEPSVGYYSVLSIIILLILWCFVSTLVVLRYESKSSMRYSFVYRSNSKSCGIVKPWNERSCPEVVEGHNYHILEGTKASREVKDSSLKIGEENMGGQGVIHSSAMSHVTCEEDPSFEVKVQDQGEDDDDDDGGTDDVARQECYGDGRIHLLPQIKIKNPKRSCEYSLGGSSKTSRSTAEPHPSSVTTVIKEGGADNDGDIGGGDDDDCETFAPPNHKLLKKAFRYRPGFWTKICYMFCLKSNLSNLTKDEPTRLIGLDCTRVISFWFLLLVQVYLFAMKFGIIANISLKKELIREYILTYIIAFYPLALDALFFVSGFLSIINMKSRKWDSYVFIFIIRRYLRLFLPLAFILLVNIYLLPYWTSYSGPQSFKFENAANQCLEHWWKLILGIQNFVPSWEFDNIDGCLQWTWIVASQWQQSIFVSLIFIFTVNKVFIFSHVFLLVASLLAIASLIATFELKPNVIGYISDPDAFKELNNYLSYVLTKPYTWIAPYAIGVLLSYKLRPHKNHQLNDTNNDSGNNNNNNNNNAENENHCSCFKGFVLTTCFKKDWCWIGWICCLLVVGGFVGLNCSVLFLPGFNSTGNIVSGTFYHLFWPLVLCWIVYACYHGRNGFLNWFSTLKFWMYLGRLTYSAFLFHGLSIMCICSSWTSVIEMGDQLSVFIIFSTSMVMSYSAALIIHLLIEAPLLNILTLSSPDE